LIRVIGLRLPIPKIDHRRQYRRFVLRTNSLIIPDFSGEPSSWFKTGITASAAHARLHPKKKTV
jgi:hypothetical protein